MFNLKSRGIAANAHIGPIVVTGPQPPRGKILNLMNVLKQILLQPLRAHRAVIALNIGVLLRLAWLNVNVSNRFLSGPGLEPAAHMIRAVIAPVRRGLPRQPFTAAVAQTCIRGIDDHTFFCTVVSYRR